MTLAPAILDKVRQEVQASGFVIPTVRVPEDVLANLAAAVSTLELQARLQARGGVRDLFRIVPEVSRLAGASPLRDLAVAVLGEECFAVRAVLFDKTPGTNWKIGWHQDCTIVVRSRYERVGFGPWTTKDGLIHVQAPSEVLAGMLTVRLHLDPCGVANGPLRVVPGSHQSGRLDPAGLDRAREAGVEVDCLVEAGGMLVLRPLLVHASSSARMPGHRRVIHLEYAAASLPAPLEWHERWGSSGQA